MLSWADTSEIVAGLILANKLALNAVKADDFFPPYDEIIKALKQGHKSDELIEIVGLTPVQTALEAAKSVATIQKQQNWTKLLENAANNYTAGVQLEKLGRKLQAGEKIDYAQLTVLAANAQKGVSGDFIPLGDIPDMEIPFKTTGFKPIDTHLGGLPQVGQILLGASPGSGKTSLLVTLALCWAKEHPNEKVAIYTLEMALTEIKMRFNEVSDKDYTPEQKANIIINEHPVVPDEVISKAAGIENLGIVFVDFADLLVRGETTESSMANIYRTFMLGSKALQVPIVVLSQLNRGYNGGIPRPSLFRYTGLAEALAWMILMLYNPTTDWFTDEGTDADVLPAMRNKAYILAWKVRGGFRQHRNDSPGAIQVTFVGNKGWRPDLEGKWFSLKKLA